jgi:mRNA-degrading endonuclease RelE of RelBE toxin-antitoxin system
MSSQVEAALARMPRNERVRAEAALRELEAGPYHPKGLRLAGRSEWRLAISGRRAIYRVDFDARTIAVVRLGSRSDVYKDD